MNTNNYAELAERARRIRINALKAIHAAKSGHPGGSLSAADIIATLYFEVLNIDPQEPDKADRDKFIISKGHAVPALYAALGERGFYDVDDMMTLRQVDSRFQGHPNMHKVPGIEMSTGSLGQGFSAAVGMAIAGKIDNNPGRVYVLAGDGELQEGIVWEAAMQAAHRHLDNLAAIVDLNGLQIDGKVSDVKEVSPVDEKFKSFGWNVIVVNGHNYEELIRAFAEAKECKTAPTAIIAHTHKGKGVSFMEDNAGWHGKAPGDEELATAIEELGGDN